MKLQTLIDQYRAHQKSLGAAAGPFFTTRKGAQVNHDTFRHNFRLACDRAAIRREDGGRFQPRLHDLRHTSCCGRKGSACTTFVLCGLSDLRPVAARFPCSARIADRFDLGRARLSERKKP